MFEVRTMMAAVLVLSISLVVGCQPTIGVTTQSLASGQVAPRPSILPVALSPQDTPQPAIQALQPASASLQPQTPTISAGTKIVCIDPGHPSETSEGTKGQFVTENQLNWAIGQRLQAALQQAGYQVVLTKTSENENVTNKRRAEIAKEARAGVMLRLHCDFSSVSGYQLFAPDRQGTHSTGVTGPSQAVIQSSQVAAQAVYGGMATVLGSRHKGLGVKGDSATAVGEKQGALTGSIFSQVPAVTVEMASINLPADENFIRSDEGQALMVQALTRGVQAYLGNNQ